VIRLTRLNGSELYLNADLVATVEAHHDTVVTLVDGKTYVVLETAEAVVQRITDYRAAVLASAELQLAPQPDAEGGQVLHLHPVHEQGR
jgi:flagellar protein FlbD